MDYSSPTFGVLSWTMPELAVTGNTGTISSGTAVSGTKIPDIVCSMQQITTFIDASGRTITVKSSQIYRNNPLFALTATTSGNPVAGGVSDIMFNCNAKTLGVYLEPSNLTFVLEAQASQGGAYVPIMKKSILTGKVGYAKDSSAFKSIGTFSFYGKDIEEALKATKEFTSNVRVKVYGNLKVHWTNYATPLYTFPIGINDIPITYPVKVVPAYKPTTSTTTTNVKASDLDGDGFIDTYDTCPYQKETFNGYKDTDGCPDTPPVPTTQTDGTDEQPVTQNTCPAGQVWSVNKCVSNDAHTVKITCDVNTVAGTNGCIPLKSFIASCIKLEGGSICQTVPDVPTFDVGVQYLPTNSLTGDLKGSQKRVAEMELRPQIDFSQVTKTIGYSNPQFVHKYDLLVNGEAKVSDADLSSRQMTLTNSMSPTKFYQISLIKIQPEELFQKLREVNGGGFNLSEGDALTFVLKVSGGMSATSGLDKFSVAVDGLEYSYNMVWTDSTSADPEPCQGLSGQAIVDCLADNDVDTTDDGSTGGYCENLTAEQCLEAGKDQPINIPGLFQDYIDSLAGKDTQNTGNPKGSGGDGIFCDGVSDITECIAILQGNLNKTESGVQFYQVVVYGLIFLIFILFIIVIVKLVRRKR